MTVVVRGETCYVVTNVLLPSISSASLFIVSLSLFIEYFDTFGVGIIKT